MLTLSRPLSKIEPIMSSPIAAFFDLDNTIIPGAAIERDYFLLLWRHGVVGVHDFFKSALWLMRKIPPFSLDPLRRHKPYLVGKSVATIESQAQAFFWEKVCPRISEHARSAIEAHRAENHHIVLLTGSPDFLVEPLATFLKIEQVAAGRLERGDMVYTGHMIDPYPYRDGKRVVAAQLATDKGYDLRQCYMYGDSPGDLPVLEAVGNPRVVNPIRGMARIARRRGWPILRWR
jgi:HAD superfamily hydrolase (TIGR01490 family)